MAVGIRRMTDVGLSTSILKFNSMISSIDCNSTPNISSPYKHTLANSSHSPINNENVPTSTQNSNHGSGSKISEKLESDLQISHAGI
jgi:hypothetical protein